MLTNIYFLLPEIFLTITSVILLGYGVVLVKFDKKRSQINKLTNLTSLSFFFAGLLLIDQLGYSDKISISNGLLISDQSIVFIKLILVLTSGIILLLPNKLKMSELEAAGYNVDAFSDNIKRLLIDDLPDLP